MKFNELTAQSLTEQFVETIEEMIFSGELKPGERLPAERDLAKSMNVSQTIVNNGFSILAGRGLLNIVPRKGTFVADYINEGGFEAFASLVNYSKKHLPSGILRSIYEYRADTEKTFFRLALDHIDEEACNKIEAFRQQFFSAEKAKERTIIWYDTLHFVSEVSGNPVYSMMITGFKQLYLNVLEKIFEVTEPAEFASQVSPVFESLIDHDLQRLEKSIQQYQTFELNTLEENRFFES